MITEIDVVFHLKMARRGRNMLRKTKNKVTRVSVATAGILRKREMKDSPLLGNGSIS
jgi:hypothetical protein